MILYRVCAMGIMKEWQAMSCSACHAMLRRSELMPVCLQIHPGFDI